MKPKKLFVFKGGFTGSSYQVELKGGNLVYTQFGYGYEKENEKIFKPTKEQWAEFSNVLDEIDIWGWGSDYDDPSILDGTSWKVEIKLNKKKITSRGSNAIPPDKEGYRNLFSAVRQLIDNEPVR